MRQAKRQSTKSHMLVRLKQYLRHNCLKSSEKQKNIWGTVREIGSRAWQPTPGFLPGESYAQKSRVGPWVAKSQTRLKRLSTVQENLHTKKVGMSDFSL